MDGGLLDIGAIQQMMQPTEEDRKRARQQAILMAGLNMMGRPKGAEWQTIGQAGLLGMGMYNNQLASIPQQRMQGLKTAADLQGLMLKQREMQNAEGARQAEAEFYTRPPGAGTSQPAVAATTGGAMPKQSLSDRYSALAQYLASKGYVDQARKAEELALKFQRKLKDTKTLTQDGQRVTVNFYDDGTQELVPYGPDQEKAHFADNGAMTGIPQDPFTGKVLGAGIQKSLTPDAMLHDETARRGQNMTDARAREFNANARANQSAGQLVETADGYVRVGKDNSVTPVMGAGGQLQPKPTGAITQQVASNNVMLQKIDRAEGLINKSPDAFGLKNLAGDQVMQRLDPSGVEARAAIADIAGQRIHDRSGAAVTVGEAVRLKPYVPNVTDTPETVKKKLAGFKREYMQMQRELAGGKSIAQAAGSGRTDINSLLDKYAPR